MERNQIDTYQELYDELQFEDTMAAIRKKTVLRFLNEIKPNTLLEIGCGNDSIINHYTAFKKCVVIEPSIVFFKRLQQSETLKTKEVICVNNFFSAAVKSSVDFNDVDGVLVSGLLHELPEADVFLKDLFDVLPLNVVIHINVPNANSFHRLLALQSGLIKNVEERSDLQIKLQQPHTFTQSALNELVQNAGFKVIKHGSYFIKPFTHVQMQHIQDNELFHKNIIDGLEKMIEFFPDNGAEIFVEVVKRM